MPVTTQAKSQRILVIEDNAKDVYLLRHALLQGGADYEITVLSDGDQVPAFLQELRSADRPCLIVVDLRLARVDGLEVLKPLKESPVLAGVPIAVLTSSPSAQDRQRALVFGADHYFKKPSALQHYVAIAEEFKRICAAAA